MIVQVKVDITYTQATWVTVGFATYTNVLQENKVTATKDVALRLAILLFFIGESLFRN